MQKIRLRRNALAGYIPTVNDLEYGELYYNYTDNLLFSKQKVDANNDQIVSVSPGAHIPVARVTDVSVVADLASLLAIQSPDEGDIVVISQGVDAGNYIHNGGSAGNISDWTLLAMAPIISVNGQVGAVVLNSTHIDDAGTDKRFVSQAMYDFLSALVAAGGVDGGDDTLPINRTVATLAGTANAVYSTDYTQVGFGTIDSTGTYTADATKALYEVADTENVGQFIQIAYDGTDWNLVRSATSALAYSDTSNYGTTLVELIGSDSVSAAGVDFPQNGLTITIAYA